MKTAAAEKKKTPTGTSDNKENYEEKKQREKELRRLKNEVERQEKEIEKLEAKSAEIEKRMLEPDFYNDEAASQQTLTEHGQLKKKLETVMEEWEGTAEELLKAESAD